MSRSTGSDRALRVGVEASIFARTQKSGVDYFSLGLVQAAATAMPDARFDLGYIGSPGTDLGVEAPNIHRRAMPWMHHAVYAGLYRYLTAPPFDLVTGIKADVFFFPNFVRYPLTRGRKSVVLIHDTAFHDWPNLLIDRHRKYLEKFVPRSAHEADHIVVNSAFTKLRLRDVYGVPEEKVTVIHPIVHPERFRPTPPAEVQSTVERYGIEGKYILNMGTQEPRKNLLTLMRAYAGLPRAVRDEYMLVLAGGAGRLEDADIKRTFSELSRDHNIRRTGYIAEVDVPAIYSGASLFVFPSLYEGFGIPVLEAMACGVPVVAADNSALPEAAGEAGWLIRADDVGGLAQAMDAVLRDASLADEMRRKGREHAGRFDGRSSGERMKGVLERVAGG